MSPHREGPCLTTLAKAAPRTSQRAPLMANTSPRFTDFMALFHIHLKQSYLILYLHVQYLSPLS